MLKHMRELQKRLIPTSDHTEELAKIEQIFNELKPKLECGGAVSAVSWILKRNSGRKWLRRISPPGSLWVGKSEKNCRMAGILSTVCREDPGIVISEGK